MIQLKRIYLPPEPADGHRVLVERLWPRGISKTNARVDLWLKAIAPSAELRRWYAHDATRWEEFQARYRLELDSNPDPVEQLLALTAQGTVTLLYAARDEPGNSAQLLQAYLKSILS